MNILAIESASTICGTALFLNNELVEIDELNQSKVHSENLPSMINNINRKFIYVTIIYR